MEKLDIAAVPTLDFDVAVHSSSTLDSTVDPFYIFTTGAVIILAL
jgi:hypothetical protein